MIKNLKLKKGLALISAAGICLTFTGCDSATIDDLKSWIEGLENVSVNIHINTDKQESTTVPVETTTATDVTTTELVTDYTASDTTTTTTYVSTETTFDTTLSSSENITTTTTTKPYTIADVGMDGYGTLQKQFDVVDDIYECIISEELNTLWRVATKYCPEGKSVALFVDEIKELNGKTDNSVKPGDKIKVPARLIYSVDGFYADYAYRAGYTTFEELSELNNISIDSRDDIDENWGKMLVKVLPEGTTNFLATDNKMVNIYCSTLIRAESFVPCKPIFENQTVSAAIFTVSIGDYSNEYYYAEFQSDGTYSAGCIGSDIGHLYVTSNGEPVFQYRSSEEAAMYAEQTGFPASCYESAIWTVKPDLYTFYQDLNGNVCFVMNGIDLTKYGYVEISKYDYINLEKYYELYPDARPRSLINK